MNFSDPAFLERVRSRDEAALTAVVSAYASQLFRAALGAGVREQEAEEVVQETFVSFVEGIERFEGRSHIRTWLFGILYNKISESFRRKKRDQANDSIEDVFEARFDTNGSWMKPPRDVEQLYDDAELRAHIQDCMEGLSDKQKNAFLMREVQGFPTNEVCDLLAVTTTNLGVLLFRARNGLRECLEDKGVHRP